MGYPATLWERVLRPSEGKDTPEGVDQRTRGQFSAAILILGREQLNERARTREDIPSRVLGPGKSLNLRWTRCNALNGLQFYLRVSLGFGSLSARQKARAATRSASARISTALAFCIFRAGAWDRAGVVAIAGNRLPRIADCPLKSLFGTWMRTSSLEK